MKISILGGSGCVAKFIIEKLMHNSTFEIFASYRGKKPEYFSEINWLQVDIEKGIIPEQFFKNTDVLIYLIHSLDNKNYQSLDKFLAEQTASLSLKYNVKKLIYLGGIIPDNSTLSNHLASRKEVGTILQKSGIDTIEVRASIVIGHCSASYQIAKNLVEKLPIMITPKWLSSLCSPIGGEDVAEFIFKLIINNHLPGIYEIGSDTITYKQLLQFIGSEINNRHPIILSTPFYSINLSVFWLNLITKVDSNICKSLANSLINNTNVQNNTFKKVTGRNPIKVKDIIANLTKHNSKLSIL
jgi:uncharacterized protein YbjT (DUF2867 family)